jgi:2-oxoglutarate ferredoxin oxidoreductase subunit beta
VRHFKDIIKQGVQHKGMAFIECLQPCPTYNDITTKDWYAGEDRKDAQGKAQSRLYKLEETAGWDPVVKDWSEDWKKKAAAIEKTQEWGDRIPIGVFYKNELEPTFQERYSKRIPFYLDRPPAKQSLCNDSGFSHVDLKQFLDELKTS